MGDWSICLPACFLNVLVYKFHACSVWRMTEPVKLTESVYNVNITTKKTFSLLPELEVVSRCRRQRWWLVWRRRQHQGHSFLQLELEPSGITHWQKNPISRHSNFKINTHTHTTSCCSTVCQAKLPSANLATNLKRCVCV